MGSTFSRVYYKLVVLKSTSLKQAEKYTTLTKASHTIALSIWGDLKTTTTKYENSEVVAL